MQTTSQLVLKTGEKFIVYKILFRSLTALELYLRGDPKVNQTAFPSQKSIYMPEKFAGDPLDVSIGYCHGGYEKGFDVFLRMNKEFDAKTVKTQSFRHSVPDLVGSRPYVPNLVAGTPKTMARMDRAKEKKFVKILINLAYSGDTTEEQIRNRGILTMNLVKVLEQNDIGVDLYAFEGSYFKNEIFLAEVRLKNPGEVLNVGKCYFPLCGKEFIRRLLVRVKESMPFRAYWGVGYGGVMPIDLLKECMKVDPTDILIGSPKEMGIAGDDIYLDAERFFSKLHLSKNVIIPDFRKLREESK
ncbi:MAG: hypothetical protein J5546_08585 [Lachnospiraceae bacterium]|nr:hypothetical protein [Lachnospiraceae bacterium]